MLGRMMIGKLPKGITAHDVDTLLQRVALPRENATPVENCVTWIRAAIQALQEKQWVENFDIDKLMDHTLDESDKWYGANKNLQGATEMANYTNRPL
ncbi:uncharacterized protein ARB_07351 [Trichophyton benhamiae CBS 112371]|uniref:Uncharacterized protein n=1 Tax=Arthroderma benhamiae (strain ATCC MYA-4681 / CBS 112371) TaxID=663331 RepID=D4ASY7_ARTBC|nr:uncharacterized protein ARB_07351 [Trichophyton benhamiae CBS 112371]EFE33887.1 hypothetical protein ARB_07351 [Trichophyton benhamiae CBS 112371]